MSNSNLPDYTYHDTTDVLTDEQIETLMKRAKELQDYIRNLVPDSSIVEGTQDE